MLDPTPPKNASNEKTLVATAAHSTANFPAAAAAVGSEGPAADGRSCSPMKECATNEYCDWMTCKPKLKNGSACFLRDGACKSGNCEGVLKRLCQPKKEEGEDGAKKAIGA